MKVDIRGATLELLPEKAIHWAEEKLLAFSDVHLGKAAALQSMGVPIPEERGGDLDRIASLVRRHRPREVYILGDFIHARRSWTEALDRELSAFFEDFHGVEWRLVIGNHERGSLEYLRKYPLELIEEKIEIGPFILAHGHEARAPEAFTIEGHVHPVVVVREGSLKLRLPCFVLSETGMILPSFGEMTGGFEPERADGERVIAVTGESLLEIPPPRPRRRPGGQKVLN